MIPIQFVCEDPQIVKQFSPKPICEDYPKWLDKTNSDENEFSIKNCGPAMDWINSGYIIYNAWEYTLKEKIQNFRKGTEIESQNPRPEIRKINPSIYSGLCAPIPNGPHSFFRLETDFKVVTPPGYSCMVMQPFYDFNNKNYTLFPGIIDTDKHDWVISTMGVAHDKETVVWPGDRVLQIIPFKRDEWKMEVRNEMYVSQLFHYIRGAYNKLFRANKVYK
tara:strand:+ start:1904 stop:2563 length:660 start_codon:yes stop_codon:yes gene_type:complete